MHYSLFHGVYTPISERLARAGGTLLPFGAILVLALAFGTSTIYQAGGKNPVIQSSKPAASSKAGITHNGSNKAAGTPATTASGTNIPAASTASNQLSVSSAPTGGGLGGGGGPTSGTTTSASTTSTGLPPSGTTTATVPGQDLSAGGKTILSTSPLSLTVN